MRSLLALLVLVVVAMGAVPAALAGQAFEQAAFEKAQAANSPILIHVTAPWCPTCKAQKPTVDKLEASNPALKVFLVDFDSQKDVLKTLDAKVQSTLIAYRGKKEAGRLTGTTDPAVITDLVLLASH